MALTQEAAEDMAQKTFPHMPRISHMLTDACDGLLLAMLSHVGSSSLDNATDGGGAGGSAAAAAAGAGSMLGASTREALSPSAVRGAADVLARAASLPDAASLMCETPGRLMDILLLLHYSQRGSRRIGMRALGVCSPILPALELLTQKVGGLLPPMLTPPTMDAPEAPQPTFQMLPPGT